MLKTYLYEMFLDKEGQIKIYVKRFALGPFLLRSPV